MSLGVSIELDPSAPPKVRVVTRGQTVRQASWDDVDKFSGKPGWRGHLDLVELYNWNSKRSVCEGRNGPWRPKNCWILDEGSCKLYREYGWEPVRICLAPTGRTEVLESTLRPAIVGHFPMVNRGSVPGLFDVGILREATSTMSKSKVKGHSIGASISATAETSVGFLGTGGKASVCVTGTYSHNWGESTTESTDEVSGAVANVKVTLDPGQAALAQLTAKEGTLRVRVHYRAYLDGMIAADHGEKKFNGHHYFAYPVGEVLRHNGKTNEITMYEDFTLKYFTEMHLTLDDADGPPAAGNGQCMHNTHGVLSSKLNGLVLDVKCGNKDKGATVHMWPKNGTSAQKWILTSDGYVVSELSGLVLDVKHGIRDNGAELHLWPQNGTDAQKWTLTEDGYLVSKLNGLVLDVKDGNQSSGAALHMWPRNGTDAQKWKLE